MNFFRAILFCVCACAVRADVPNGWGTNYAVTVAEAATNQKPALIFFTASWCEPCKLMSHLVLVEPAVEAALADVERVAVDIDANESVATNFEIRAVPTFILLSADGGESDRATGLQPAGEFLRWLTNGITKANEEVLQKRLLNAKLAESDRLLAMTNADTQRLASELFDLCAARDETISRAGGQRLATLAARDPVAVLAGLVDSRLAVRIRAANVLRAQLGETFDVDPWSDAGTRETKIREWKNRLMSAAKKSE